MCDDFIKTINDVDFIYGFISYMDMIIIII